MKFRNSILFLLFVSTGHILRAQVLPEPDKLFAGKGFTVVPFGVSGFSTGWQTVIKPNGGYYTVGSTGNFSSLHMAVVSFRPNGELDSGFGINGKGVYYAGEQSLLDEAICATMIGEDLYLGGYVKYVDSIQDMVVLKLKSNGNRDSSWGKDGAVQLDFGDLEHVISLYPTSGGLLVLGSSTILRAGSKIHIAQLLANGQPDSAFSQDGKQSVEAFSFVEGVRSVIDKNGNIFICGSVGSDPMPWLVKLDKNLEPDYSFGDSGVAVFETAMEGKMYGLAVLQSGNIAVTGSQELDQKWISTTYMFSANGRRDSSFAGSGQITSGSSPQGDYGYDIMEGNDGQIYQLMNCQENTGASTAITRWNSNGVAYWNFGKLGIFKTQFSPRQDGPYHLTKDSVGRILISGSGYIYNTYSGFLLARLWLDNTLKTNMPGIHPLPVVFPNPAKDGFSVQVPETKGAELYVQIFDLQGRQVFSTRSTTQNREAFVIKSGESRIQPGMYFVVVSNGSNVWSEKLQILAN